MSIHFLMPLLIVFSLVYLGLLFKKPEYALLLSVLMIFDFFSLIPEDFLRMPGVFRLKDIFLILAFVPFLNGLFNRDPKIRVVIKSVIGKCILFLIFITACQLFLTNFLYPSESVNSIFRAGRKYFYYLLFFPAYYILIDYGRLKSFIRLLVLSICSFCVLFMLQFFLADKVKIFSGKIAVQNLQGFMVTRMYLSGAALVNVIFLIVLFILLLSPIVKKKSYFLLMILTGLQIFFGFGRANIFSLFLGLAFIFLFVIKKKRGKVFFRVIIAFFCIFIILNFIQFRGQRLSVAVSARIGSTFEAVFNVNDTFEVRRRDSLGRMDLIKKNPIFGIGFVHDETTLFARYKGFGNALRTSDSGIITLLIDFGLIGFLWWLITSLVFVTKCVKLSHKIKSIEKYYALGILAFYVGRMGSFITLAGFVNYDGIVIVVLCFVLIEIIEFNHKRGIEFENIHYNSQLQHM